MLTDAQKTLFAERYLQRPDDALMIVASILGREEQEKNPLNVIALANSLPFDDYVVTELDRLKSRTLSKEEFLRELHENCRAIFSMNETGEYIKGMRLYAEVNGFIKKSDVADKGKSDDRLKELAEMVLGTDG